MLMQVVALVGPSGGGKTSIVKLVERFYLPDAGAVLLDGLEVGAYDPRWLKRRVALVAQVPPSLHAPQDPSWCVCDWWCEFADFV